MDGTSRLPLLNTSTGNHERHGNYEGCCRFAGSATQTPHADMPLSPLQAASNMQQFMRSNALSPMVMVCTDRSSRGMDFDRAEVSAFFSPWRTNRNITAGSSCSGEFDVGASHVSKRPFIPTIEVSALRCPTISCTGLARIRCARKKLQAIPKQPAEGMHVLSLKTLALHGRPSRGRRCVFVIFKPPLA